MFRQQRVVVSGVGVVAPNGIGREAFWSSLLEGRSGIGMISHFNTDGFRARIAGEIKDFDIRRFVDASTKTSRLSRQAKLALAAASLASRDAGIPQDFKSLLGNVPIYVGISSSAMEVVENGFDRLARRGAIKVPTNVVEASSPQQSASVIAAELGFPSTTHTIASACAAGLEAIGMAADIIRTDQAELVVSGGADAPINRVSFASFDQAGLSSRRNDAPEKASRPFDRDCDSGVISEGAGIVFLENYAHAEARKATPYLEILGMGSHADPPETQPMSGLATAMELALANAGLSTRDIDFICAHGPGHPVIDLAETNVIKSVFGRDARRIPVTSIKGNTGNPLAAAGPMQLIACALCLQTGFVHPIANHENPRQGCDLDYVAGHPRQINPKVALINAHGMGGGNSCMVVRKVERS